MSIDRMKHVTFLAPRPASGRLVEWLQKRRLVHVEDAADALPEGPAWTRPALSNENADAKLRELEAIRDVYDAFAPLKRSFVQGFVNLPMRVSRKEMERVADGFDHAPLYDECKRIAEEHREHDRAIAEAEAERETLGFFDALPFTPEQLRSLRRTRAWVGSMSPRNWEALRADAPRGRGHGRGRGARAGELLALQELAPARGQGTRDKRTVHLCAVALTSDREEAERILRDFGFTQRPLPPLRTQRPLRPWEGAPARGQGTLDGAAACDRAIAGRREANLVIEKRARELAGHRREVEILLGYWRAERTKIQVLNNMATRRRVAVLCGYVRAADVSALEDALAGSPATGAGAFPEASTLYRDPTPEDKNVPVSLSHSRFIKPIRFLVDFFGLPDYFSFDPTAYLSLSFLIFFGMCFGDVAYGLLLCGVAGWLARKARGYEHAHNFCMLFLYCGISTIIFGVLTGSWMSDLWKPEYLGEGNVLLWLKERTALVEPLDKAIVLLLLCLGIGIINQFYGVILKGYGLLRRGKRLDALLDAGLWLVMIPSFLVVVSVLFFPKNPRWLFRTAVAVALAAAVGLVLTQGRRETGFVAKAATGLVSLYGIMGSYGCVSFIGDMLSYTRLLALGLTTAIVGMSFNIIAGLLKGVPWVGVGAFIVVVLFGHAFNFAVSILGAFVHPARLIFLEFFSRFYESGGVRFRPLSLDTEGVIVE